MNVRHALERALAASHSDACIALGRRESNANVRWANNAVTTNGAADEAAATVVAVRDGAVGTVDASLWSEEQVDALVHDAEAACAGKPRADDDMPLVDGGTAGWDGADEPVDLGAFDGFAPRMAGVLAGAERDGVKLFGYARVSAPADYLATSAGARLGHRRVSGRVELTAKSEDFSRSAWAGHESPGLGSAPVEALYDRLRTRLEWEGTRHDLPPGRYEVILEPAAVAGMLLYLVITMTAREADEGRSAFSRPGGGNRVGDRLFADAVDLYSDPRERGIETEPYVSTAVSSSYASVFDNGMPAGRVTWAERGVLRALVTPRWWAKRTGAEPVPYIGNVVIPGRADGPSVEHMVASSERALLVTRFWYIRLVDPKTLLLTGLTRDGVYLVEDGRVRGAVNNFRFNHSPVEMLANVAECGRAEIVSSFAKVPPLRVREFHMSSVSEAV